MVKQSVPQYTSVLKFILHFASRQKFVFMMQGVLCCAWSIKEALFPYFIKLILNGVYGHGDDWPQLMYFMYGLVVIWTMMEIAMRVQGILSVRAFPLFRANIKQHFFEACISQVYGSFVKHPVGVYVDHITHLPQSCQTVLEIILLHFISIGGALLISLFLLAQVNIAFFVILLLWLCCHLGLTLFMNPQLAKTGIAHANSVNRLSGKINDALNNFLAITWFGHKKYEFNRFAMEQNSEVNKASHAQLMIERMRLFQGGLAIAYMLTMVMVMAHYWQQHLILIGDLTLIPMLSFSALGMVWWLTQELNTLYRELNRIRSGLVFLGKINQEVEAPLTKITTCKKIDIQCQNLSFKYSDQVLFDCVSFNISATSHVGIAGISGSGKTTLLKILTGVLQPGSGEVYLDQQNIAQINGASLSQLIAVVPQEPVVLNRTIFDNIHYGQLTANKMKVVEVAKQALCHEFIEALPDQYNTMVGDGGVTLSVGQRQRLMLARALLTDAPVIILDEPTASLDSITEKLLLKMLKATLADKTVIIISHKVSTLSIADRILVFDQGQLVEDGEMNALYHKKGKFYQFILQQTPNVPISEKK